MDINNVRISNIPRESLGDLWKVVSSDDLNELILRSNEKEISILFGHLSENGIVETIRSIKDPSIAKIFSSLPFNLISKVLNLVDEKSTQRIISVLDRRLILKLMRGSNKQIKNKIMNSLPEERKSMLLEISGEDNVLDNEYKYYLSDKFENSIELDALNRIKKLEEREHYLEARQKSREEQYFGQLDNLKTQISETEKEIHARQSKFKSLENSLLKREQELKDNIRILQEEHNKKIQEKIEIKVPEFVKSAMSVLEKKEKDFVKEAKNWNIYGSISLGLAMLSAFISFIYGSFEFHAAAKENIDWIFFTFLLLKGLIIVSLFCAFAKHAYNIGNAYMHESLKRSDRMHAINFGKFYLEVYGNDVSQNDMKSIFENWNMDSDSAFTKIRKTDFEPKFVNKLVEVIKDVSNKNKSNNEN